MFKRLLSTLVLLTLIIVPTGGYAANEVLQKVGTPIVVANSTYSPGANTTLGTRTDDIDCDGLTTGQAREGVKIDLGATRARQYAVRMTTEFATDPVTGETVDLYWSESHSASAAVGNTGGTTGADADYAGYGSMTLAESLNQIKFIGSLVLGAQNTADGVVIGTVGVFSPSARYGVLIVHNNTSDTMHSDSVEMAVLFEPIVDEVQ